eukprot:6198325-Pleurochrysis_carterae.AAC.2
MALEGLQLSAKFYALLGMHEDSQREHSGAGGAGGSAEGGEAFGEESTAGTFANSEGRLFPSSCVES